MKKQYVFNEKLFKDYHNQCPVALCFPTFFAYSIYALINNTMMIEPRDKKLAVQTLFQAFISILPTLIKHVFNGFTPRMEKNMYHTILTKPGKDDGFNKLKLETYFLEEKDRIRYHEVLQEINLAWNQVTSINDLVKYLTSTGICPLGEDQEEEYPNSLQYTRFNTNAYIQKQGPAFWGPYYWKIFHFVATVDDELKKEEEDDVTYMKDAMPSILPILVPCNTGEMNSHRYIRPSKLLNVIEEPIRVYRDIHTRVTHHK